MRPGTWPTLVSLLEDQASKDADYVPYAWMDEEIGREAPITASALAQRARAVGAALSEHARPGDRALLLYPPSMDYVVAMFGCLYAGAVAVPAYPPDPRRLARTLPRLAAIVRSSQATVVLTTAAIRSLADPLVAQEPGLGGLRWIATDDLTAAKGSGWSAPAIDADTVALLQFTSGSTSMPRGVILKHATVLANLRAIHSAFGAFDGARGVCWLPPYHDMGLIGGILEPLYGRSFQVLMSPLTFLKKPALWIRALSHYRATISGGPNFAYDACVRKVDLAREQLDLSSWKVAFNGAEVVRADTLERFAEKFAPVGFRRSAFLPCYGLAEVTLIAAGAAAGRGPVSAFVDGRALEQGKAVAAAAEDAADARLLTSSGRAVPGFDIAIVDPETARRRADGEVGEVWLSGPSVGAGYWGMPEETARTFGATIAGEGELRYVRTGDLGFLRQGELFVCGRLKDVIIVRGRNLFPDDIERVAAAAHPALRAGCTAAFAMQSGGEEHLAVAQEIDASARDLRALEDAIREAVTESCDVVPWRVFLLRAGALLKTSSGKVQRRACHDALRDGGLDLATVG